MNAEPLNIGLDLGSDSLKISFAYGTPINLLYGKITAGDQQTHTALPALAYYDPRSGRWYYGEQVDNQSTASFITVVKIKQLLSLLSKPAAGKTKKAGEQSQMLWEQNRELYQNGHDFPKFYFPVRRAALTDFKKMIGSDMTFRVPDMTPADVCRRFFAHVRELVDGKKAELERMTGRTLEGYKIAFVYPADASGAYIEAVSDLIQGAFGTRPYKLLNTNKAIALYARHCRLISSGDRFLAFDMGEESISVVQGFLKGSTVFIDGIEGHSEPVKLGGNDVDEAIVRHLEQSIDARETFGTPPKGEVGHITEGCVYAKQYQLMKDIKEAKVILSRDTDKGDVFRDGVPITFCCEVMVQRRLTEADIRDCIRKKQQGDIADRVVSYILDELKRPINAGVGKILISGGLAETYSLLDDIRRQVKSAFPNVDVCTFDYGLTDENEYHIQSYEDSTFVPAVGGAMVAFLNIDIPTVLSLSYGTWVYTSTSQQKEIRLFVQRGELLEPDGGLFLTQGIEVGSANRLIPGVEKEEIYSTIATLHDLQRLVPGGRLIVGDPGTAARRQVETSPKIGLRVVSGGNAGNIDLYYGGYKVQLLPGNKIWIREGIQVDKDGRATPVVYNGVYIADYTLPSGRIVPVVRSERNVMQTTQGKWLVAIRCLIPGAGYRDVRVPAYTVIPRFRGLDAFNSSIT